MLDYRSGKTRTRSISQYEAQQTAAPTPHFICSHLEPWRCSRGEQLALTVALVAAVPLTVGMHQLLLSNSSCHQFPQPTSSCPFYTFSIYQLSKHAGMKLHGPFLSDASNQLFSPIAYHYQLPHSYDSSSIPSQCAHTKTRLPHQTASTTSNSYPPRDIPWTQRLASAICAIRRPSRRTADEARGEFSFDDGAFAFASLLRFLLDLVLPRLSFWQYG